MYEVYSPKSQILKKHIYNFCILKPFAGEANYLAFPQLGTSIGLYPQSDLTVKNNHVTISNKLNQNTQILLLGKYKNPIHITYHNYTPELSINFTATGLNYFFKENTGTMACNVAQLIDDQVWKKMIKTIFKEKNNLKKINILENILIKQILKKDISLIENYLRMFGQKPEYNLTQLAKNLQVSAKTISRGFKKYIGCSPLDFKKISRFRAAVNLKFNTPKKNLTQICYEGNFYDSPHFSREFKKLTGLTPREFFLQIESIEDTDIPYKFI